MELMRMVRFALGNVASVASLSWPSVGLHRGALSSEVTSRCPTAWSVWLRRVSCGAVGGLASVPSCPGTPANPVRLLLPLRCSGLRHRSFFVSEMLPENVYPTPSVFRSLIYVHLEFGMNESRVLRIDLVRKKRPSYHG